MGEEHRRAFRVGSEEELLFVDRLARLDGFSRIAYRFGKIISLTGSATVKAKLVKKPVTSVDSVYEFLQSIGAYDWNSGRSSAQIARHLGLAQITVSKAVSELESRGRITHEKRGKMIHYFLPSKP